jgi:hypothetical protein
VCTAIAISHWESCGGHLLGGSSCGGIIVSFVRGIEGCESFHTFCGSIVAMAEADGVFDLVYECHCVCLRWGEFVMDDSLVLQLQSLMT